MNKDYTQSSISWIGSENSFLDNPTVDKLNHITIGRYGGNTTVNANKNEDGLLIWSCPEKTWEFVVLLDAHSSSESAELIINSLNNNKESIFSIMEGPVEILFNTIEEHILGIFKSEEFITACRSVKGESSCLICVRKENYLWWLSVGDCMLFILHPDLINMGQTLLNQRNFYEWIGRVNTFELTIPCFSSGCRELRTGSNFITAVTDGYLHNDLNINSILDIYNGEDLSESVGSFLTKLHHEQTIDSTTVIAWCVENDKTAAKPSK